MPTTGYNPKAQLGVGGRVGIEGLRSRGRARWRSGTKAPEARYTHTSCSSQTHFPGSVEHWLNNTLDRLTVNFNPQTQYPTLQKLFHFLQIPRPNVAEVARRGRPKAEVLVTAETESKAESDVTHSAETVFATESKAGLSAENRNRKSIVSGPISHTV